jgi:fucose 4-O-acetylase-like acetyltransferase
VPIAINRTGWNPYGAHQFWRSSPYYFFFRLGNVMAVLTALMAVERLVDRYRLAERFAAVRATLGLAETLGQESLVVYVAHLVVLHGCVLGPGLRSVWGRALPLREACLVTAALIVTMIALALGWHAAKAVLARPRRPA